jgi:hypothetical protein
MTLVSFLNNLVAGLIASLATVGLLEYIRIYRLRKRFKPLEGAYRHFDIDGEQLLDGKTEIRYCRGNVLEARTYGGDGDWQGNILMNEDVPSLGNGIYQYAARPDCGVLQVQVSQADHSLFVHVVNTSHGKERVFAYIWRKL